MNNTPKAALVVGGTKGFGLATTKALIELGYTVATISREKSDETGFDQFYCDVIDSASLQETLKKVQVEYYFFDLVACIVGNAQAKALNRFSGKNWLEHMRLNFTYVDVVFEELQTALRYSDRPVGITIGSRFSHSGTYHEPMLPYICAKYALRGLTRDYATRLPKLKINNYCVVPMDTPGRKKVFKNGFDIPGSRAKILGDPGVIAKKVIDHAIGCENSGETFVLNHTGTVSPVNDMFIARI